MGSQCANKQFQDLASSIRETFPNSIDLTVINEYDKGTVMQISTVFGHIYHVACRSVLWIFGITKSMRVVSFSKCSKFNLDFKYAAKNIENVFFFFWDSCIWIGIVKLSLLRTAYFSSAVNMLTSCPKIGHVNKRDVFQLH